MKTSNNCQILFLEIVHDHIVSMVLAKTNYANESGNDSCKVSKFAIFGPISNFARQRLLKMYLTLMTQ